MGTLSKTCRVCFEIINELYTAVGAGVLGMVVLVQHGFRSHQTVKTLSVVGLTAASLVFAFSREKQKILANKKKVVVITGCDSGLGFSLVQHSAECGFTVIATFLNLDSKGSKEIKRLYGGYIIQIQLDITDTTSIQNAVQTLEHYFSKNPGYGYRRAAIRAEFLQFHPVVRNEEDYKIRIMVSPITGKSVLDLRKSNSFFPIAKRPYNDDLNIRWELFRIKSEYESSEIN